MPVELSVDKMLDSVNLAENIDEQELREIGTMVVENYDNDEDSRADWLESNLEWMKLAAQVIEEKNTPWPGASNTKFPLLTTAAIQFHARAYPSLIKSTLPVKLTVFGRDEGGAKEQRSNRVAEYMSYQVLHEMEEWPEDMDRLLFVLPMTGLCYKKTYYSYDKGRNVSKLVLAEDLALNYHATDFNRARKTERFWMDKNEYIEYVNQGLFLDEDLSVGTQKVGSEAWQETTQLTPPGNTEDDPYEFLEAHTWYDLDDDGYKEPYVITVDRDTRKVLRIVPRFTVDGVEQEGKDIIKIDPVEMYTQYKFLPDPNSAVSALGFGALLGPLNASINTIINQLTDAGTLSNMQSGFLGRGIRIRGGKIQLIPGQWQMLQTTGDDIRKNIFPMPVREPSSTLFSLLGFLVEHGSKLSSVTDLMSGSSPGQNQPFSTTSSMLEQGLKVYVGIYKRIFRSLASEYRKLYNLNRMHLQDDNYSAYLDMEGAVVEVDFENKEIDVTPAADPNLVSEAQKLLKAEALIQKMSAGLPINPQEVAKRLLEAEDHEDVEKLLQMPQKQPPVEIQIEKMRTEAKQKESEAKAQLDMIRVQNEAMKDKAQAMALMAKAENESAGTDLDRYRLELEKLKIEQETLNSYLDRLQVLIEPEDDEEELDEPTDTGGETL